MLLLQQFMSLNGRLCKTIITIERESYWNVRQKCSQTKANANKCQICTHLQNAKLMKNCWMPQKSVSSTIFLLKWISFQAPTNANRIKNHWIAFFPFYLKTFQLQYIVPFECLALLLFAVGILQSNFQASNIQRNLSSHNWNEKYLNNNDRKKKKKLEQSHWIWNVEPQKWA